MILKCITSWTTKIIAVLVKQLFDARIHIKYFQMDKLWLNRIKDIDKS